MQESTQYKEITKFNRNEVDSDFQIIKQNQLDYVIKKIFMKELKRYFEKLNETEKLLYGKYTTKYLKIGKYQLSAFTEEIKKFWSLLSNFSITCKVLMKL